METWCYDLCLSDHETRGHALDIGVLFVRILQGTPSVSRIFANSSRKCGAAVVRPPGRSKHPIFRSSY